MTEQERDWIDNATLEQLLRKWRFSALGSPWFVGDTGEHFGSVMNAKRAADPEGWTAASKAIGW